MALCQSGQKWGEIAGYRTVGVLATFGSIPDWRQVDANMNKSIQISTRMDDEVMIVKVGQAMLEKLGYRAFTAQSGQGALDLYEKQREEIDLVILDMIMPCIGGGETYDRLREIDY